MLRRNWTAAQVGEMTLAQASWLLSEEPYHDGVWALMDFVSRMMGGKGAIPARAVRQTAKRAEKVVPELQKSLMAMGWRPPGVE